MSRIRTAMVAAASTAAAFGVTAVAAREFLKNQAAVARRRIGKPLGETAPDADRVWRRSYGGKPLQLLVLGDSIAAGLGAERRKEVLGARIAKAVGRRLRRPVRLRTAAIVGSESSALDAQLDGLPERYRPDVAIIIVGGNDVTHRVSRHVAVQHLERAIERLRERGAAVVVGTCPDLGALRPVPQPLRSVASRWSRQLASAQAAVAERHGAQVVSLRRAVGPMFLEQPEEMFSLDHFHPSALGYRRTAEALLPAVLAALGLAEAEAPAASAVTPSRAAPAP